MTENERALRTARIAQAALRWYAGVTDSRTLEREVRTALSGWGNAQADRDIKADIEGFEALCQGKSRPLV